MDNFYCFVYGYFFIFFFGYFISFVFGIYIFFREIIIGEIKMGSIYGD